MHVYSQSGTGLPAVMHGGEERVLGRLPTTPTVRMAFPRFAVERMPRSEWKPIDRRATLGDAYVLNQQSHGSCVGFSSVCATMRARALSGQTFQRLSGAFVYSFINGGRDNGASIGDSLLALQKSGACLEAEADWDKIYPSRIPKSAYDTALRFRIDEGYRVDEFDDACTGLQLGFLLVYPCMVGGSFDSLDGEDVVGFDRGGGNHSIHADGMYLSQRHGWCLDACNTWGLSWGKRGRFRTNQKQWEALDMDAYLIRVSVWDPLDPNQPPKVVS